MYKDDTMRQYATQEEDDDARFKEVDERRPSPCSYVHYTYNTVIPLVLMMGGIDRKRLEKLVSYTAEVTRGPRLGL